MGNLNFGKFSYSNSLFSVLFSTHDIVELSKNTKMKYKLIAIDIDGTLLNSNSEISPATSQAIRRAHEAGITVVVSTGRRFCSAKPIVEMLSLDVFLSCHNGVILKRLDGEVLYYQPLECKTARTAVKHIKETGEFPIIYHGQQDAADIFVERLHENVSERISKYIQSNKQFVKIYDKLEEQLENDIIEIVLIVEKERVNIVYDYLKGKLNSSAEIIKWMPFFSSVGFLEIAHPRTSKAEPLKHLALQLDIKPEEIVAIGDNFNDLGMLQYAGMPIVMDNAPDELKDMGFHVTLSNDKDGVASAIEDIIF